METLTFLSLEEAGFAATQGNPSQCLLPPHTSPYHDHTVTHEMLKEGNE
jgi:hypothetical protein